MEAKLIMTAEQISNRDAWLQQRKTGIGGSDASCIVGANKWRSMYSLWAEKLGYVDPEDKADVEAVHFGAVQEQIVADEFALRTGKKVKKCGLYRNEKRPFMLASIDRLVVGENAGLECKTAGAWFADEWEDDNIPDAYYFQCLHYMACCGFQRYYIACLIGGNHFVWKTIERADVQEDIDKLIAAEEEFWNTNIIGKVMPPIDSSQACSTALNKRFQKTSENEMQLDSQADDICESILRMQEEAKRIEEEIELKRNQLKDLLKDCGKAESFDYRVTYRFQKGRKTLNLDALKEEHPELDIDKYYTQGTNRVLRIARQKQKKI